jgi:sterol desaturase/sphingolipid hydroxylase (fatty acid hydroxylase superfamily)
MDISILSHEMIIRFSFFLGVLVFMATWETLAPRRTLTMSKITRWINNLSIAFLDTLTLRLLLPMGVLGMAIWAYEQGWGFLNYWKIPYGLAVVGSVVVLDFIVYLQHVLFHAIPALWRLHRVHHTDLDLDVTTGIRFHPAEMVLSTGIKLVAVSVLGCPALAVVIFEVLLNITALFNHSNVRIPFYVDRILRVFVVTPDMHRVHHSVLRHERNRNFGFNLSWWDYLFGTYCEQPGEGHDRMVLGLPEFRNAKYLTLPGLLVMPFIDRPVEGTVDR